MIVLIILAVVVVAWLALRYNSKKRTFEKEAGYDLDCAEIFGSHRGRISSHWFHHPIDDRDIIVTTCENHKQPKFKVALAAVILFRERNN